MAAISRWKSLQWGRDHLIAEIVALRVKEDGTITLQWGRDHLIAEIHIEVFLLHGGRSASMGPRSSDRGNDER